MKTPFRVWLNTGAVCLRDGHTLALFGGLLTGDGGDIKGIGISRASMQLAARSACNFNSSLTGSMLHSRYCQPRAVPWRGTTAEHQAAVDTLQSVSGEAQQLPRDHYYGGRRDWWRLDRTVNSANKTTGCTEERTESDPLFETGCEFDGKLSAVAHGEALLLYGRANAVNGPGGRHVQVAKSMDEGRSFGRWKLITIEGYEVRVENNIYLFNVQRNEHAGGGSGGGGGGGDDDVASYGPRKALVALLPAVIRGVGGIYWSESDSGLQWSRPRLLLPAPHLLYRVPVHPVGLLFGRGRPTSLLLLHNIRIVERPAEDEGEPIKKSGMVQCSCPPLLPFMCQYELPW